MSLALVAALALAPAAKYDVFLGMPAKLAQEVRGTVQTMRTVQGRDWTPKVETTAPVGPDTLVMWSWPIKGNHGIGLQLYGPGGQFKTLLEHSNIPSALATVCRTRYVVGGGNTLRVWDARQGYKLISRKTFPTLSQFARLSCTENVLVAEESGPGGQLRSLRLNVPMLTPVPPNYDLRLGLSALDWQAAVSNTGGQVSRGYAVTQELRTRTGDTLVRWSSTPGLDPKGPNGLGVQVYGPDSRFRQWLSDARAIDRDFVLCGRYLVGGGNTLRVWDTEANYHVVSRQPSPGLPKSARLECVNGDLDVAISGRRLHLPELSPAR